ncbi:stalk domain-containing protein [Alkaliphilus hydrothermalis]|uniref:Uncharacterized protein YkwD n=1 Tax=Alkaliphilus hydrothermalis TaxID=1482730 RepID=A0ABS2NQ70_9FIRM|nr:stalk domain-containing protein [Alkaliphilus hydrothermalis]MBM7614754.1 uncharacterized protein YkwD [Alkaliphilus hydrothermalis]
MKLKKTLSITLSILLVYSIITVAYGNGWIPEIKIFNNQEELTFDVPPQLIGNRVLVPIGSVLRSLGAEVSWDSLSRKVTAIKDNSIIIIPINSSTAYKNNTSVTLDVPAKIIDGRTFVPIRFLSENLGANVHWDQKNKSIFISEEESKSSLTFSIKGISLGSSLETVTKILGSPKRIDPSEYSFKWHIYHNHYKDYLQLGIKNNKVVAIYSNHPIWENETNINVASSKSTLISSLNRKPLDRILKGNVYYLYPTFKNGEEYQVYQLSNAYLTVFYDLHKNSQVSALQIIDKSVEEEYHRPLNTSAELRKAYSRQVFDLANALRVREGLSPFEWCDLASLSSEKHSRDMAESNYFNHVSLKDESPFDRMKQEGITYRSAGENIAAGQQNAIFAHEGWMNSFTGHREAIVGNYRRLGVGVWFGTGSSRFNNYFTQNFYTP